jgi:hypothetical protein
MAVFKFKNEQGDWESVDCIGTVKYTQQELGELEKAQARANIGSYITREVLLSGGNSSSFTFPADRAPADYDLICMQFCSSKGSSPAGSMVVDPKNSWAVPTMDGVDVYGNPVNGIIQLSGSNTKGETVSITPLNNN